MRRAKPARCTTACTTGRTNLGFTETTFNAQVDNFGRGGLGNDPEHGNAQAGGIVGGPPGFQSRDNANQFSPIDGVVPVTNMFLWQPVPASFYGPASTATTTCP